jgi:hypothetical protein
MKIFQFTLFTLYSTILSSLLHSAEQDNWYLAKEFQVEHEVRGMYWDYNDSTQSGLLFCATNNGIKVYDLDGSLVHSFGKGNFYDVVVDDDGIVYGSHNSGVTAFNMGPARVTSVSVDHPGSRYFIYTGGQYPDPYWHYDQNNYGYQPVYLDLNGTGSGAKAYVLMERNGSLPDSFNWFAKSVVIEDGGSGYVGDVNASILTQNGTSYKQIQFSSDVPSYDHTSDYAVGDVVKSFNNGDQSNLYELSQDDISKLSNDWNQSSTYLEGDIIRYVDAGDATWYKRTAEPGQTNDNPNGGSSQWQSIGNSIYSLAQSGLFDLTDVTQSQGYDHATFTVSVGNGYSQLWNLDSMNDPDGEAGRDISLHRQTGKLLVTDRVAVRFLDRNGTLLEGEFGSQGDAPGQFSSFVQDITVLPDSRIIVSDHQRINWFDENGSFLKRQELYYPREIAVSPSGNFLVSTGYWSDYYHLKNPDGFDITSFTGDILKGDDFNHNTYNFAPTFIGQDAIAAYSGGAILIFNSAYRTKGLPTPNKLPEPAIKSISQRPGTNIVDIVFEILDEDDDNATVGILAAENGDFSRPISWISPSSLVEGSDARIGVPIATNQEHNISWDIGQDWAASTGNLKFKIICQDGRRSSPVDIHFLELPLADGNLTISRSPIVDSDIQSYYRFLLGIRDSSVSLDNYGNVVDNYGSTLLTPSGQSTSLGRDHFIESTDHRWATFVEVGSAREGSTSGTIEKRTARNQVVPRNLPRQVNEYGFDVGSYGSNAWWVVSNSTFPYYSFSRIDADYNGSSYSYFGQKVAVSDNYLIAKWNNSSLNFYSFDAETNQLSFASTIEPSDKDQSSSEGFGDSFEITGDWIVVGSHNADAHLRDVNGNIIEWRYDTGSVYLFDVSTGSPVEAGRFDCNQSYSYMGTSLDAFGEFVLVGARNQQTRDDGWSHGGAYLLKIEPDGTFIELAHIVAEDAESNDQFGAQVAIGQNYFAISAPKARTTRPDGQTNNDGGKVYLYSYDEFGTVEFLSVLIDETVTEEWTNHFGQTIDISGSFLSVRNGDNSTSKVNLYQITDTQEVQLVDQILRPVGEGMDFQNFGEEIALDSEWLVIRSYKYWDNNRGVLFLYKISDSGNAKLAEILEPDGQNDYSAFGRSISLSGQNLAVGAPNFDRTDPITEQTIYDIGKVILIHRKQ